MKKRRAVLVVQHLERVAGAALDEFPEALRDFVRGRNGVYALYNGDRLYYVGLASNMRSRLRGHLRDRHAKKWDRFSIYLTAGDEHLKELESLVLRIAAPKGNRVAGKFGASEDLRRRFRRGLQVSLSKKVDEMTGWAEPAANTVSVQAGLKAAATRRRRQLAEKSHKAVLAPYVKKRFHIRLHHKGRQFIGHVRTDGTIVFGRESADWARLRKDAYYSPSLAAAAAVGHAMNGWSAWRFWSTKGELVPLDALRRGRAEPRF
jgi:hypothetical protein